MQPSTSLPYGNPYSLLATFLSPCPNGAAVEQLRLAARQGMFDWNLLLFQANLHFCTPLWYVRLRQKGLLAELPPGLQEYLQHLYLANFERTEAFRKSLRELLQALQSMGIPALLLKGAATYCDNLYEDNGARMMGDIDLLVTPSDAEDVRGLLLRWGYLPVVTSGLAEYSPEYLHQHLPRMLKPSSPAALEIHCRVERGHAGSVLPTALAWEGQREATFEGLKTLVLSPTLRLLHNTVHALVPQREFIRSNISLLQLAEFSALINRYEQEINWLEWYERGACQGLGREFITYLTLATRLMGIPWPEAVAKSSLAGIHARRIQLTGKYAGRPEALPEKAGERIRGRLVRLAAGLFYEVNRLPWVWRNVCYVEGRLLSSTQFLVKKIYGSVRHRDAESVE